MSNLNKAAYDEFRRITGFHHEKLRIYTVPGTNKSPDFIVKRVAHDLVIFDIRINLKTLEADLDTPGILMNVNDKIVLRKIGDFINSKECIASDDVRTEILLRYS